MDSATLVLATQADPWYVLRINFQFWLDWLPGESDVLVDTSQGCTHECLIIYLGLRNFAENIFYLISSEYHYNVQCNVVHIKVWWSNYKISGFHFHVPPLRCDLFRILISWKVNIERTSKWFDNKNHRNRLKSIWSIDRQKHQFGTKSKFILPKWSQHCISLFVIFSFNLHVYDS